MSKIDHLYMPENHMDRVYNSRNPLVRIVHRDRLNAIINSLPKKKNQVILDAGCGEGHLMLKMYQSIPLNKYYGFDVSHTALQSAKKKCKFAKLKYMDLSDIKIKNNFFDVIVCTEVIEHIYEYQDVINEFKRVLKKGGYLILTFPNEFFWTISRFFIGRKPIKVPDHVNSFTPKMMKKFVNLNMQKKIDLPFGFPIISLGWLVVFRK